jgi:hypothetical protein
MPSWKEDRERLRKEIRETKPTGLRATLLYALVSHMRGKLHMRWYQKYHGGWGSWDKKDIEVNESAVNEVRKAYGEYAETYAKRAAITSLEDQQKWIEGQLANIKRCKDLSWYTSPLSDEIIELSNRVLHEYNKEEEIARVS